MAKISTSISIDSEVKAERSIPFAIRRDLPNETTLKAMDDAENYEHMYGPFDSVAEMMEGATLDRIGCWSTKCTETPSF